MKNINHIIAVVFLFLPTLAFPNVEFIVGQDFSNEKVTTLRVDSMEQRPSTLFVSCFPSGINIQLAFNGTIFPDDISNDGMVVSITHKFYTAEEAHTTNWHMNMMKYKDAWYRGDPKQFISEGIGAQQLNLRLNRNGDIVRFDFSKALEHLTTVKGACSN